MRQGLIESCKLSFTHTNTVTYTCPADEIARLNQEMTWIRKVLFLLVLLSCCTECVWSMPRKRPAAKEKTRRKLGSAVALSQEAWDAWLVFLLQHQGPRMYILVALTGLFALRASEAAMLRREDIHLQASPPYITSRKNAAVASPRGTYR